MQHPILSNSEMCWEHFVRVRVRAESAQLGSGSTSSGLWGKHLTCKNHMGSQSGNVLSGHFSPPGGFTCSDCSNCHRTSKSLAMENNAKPVAPAVISNGENTVSQKERRGQEWARSLLCHLHPHPSFSSSVQEREHTRSTLICLQTYGFQNAWSLRFCCAPPSVLMEFAAKYWLLNLSLFPDLPYLTTFFWYLTISSIKCS
jgi:hypothetical protein